ncbi:MAG: peptidase C25, partial [Candidatus Cloacimonetes bacterium]|nr:peptidase C25 [Candidatus Cloacimonadota bacterium]
MKKIFATIFVLFLISTTFVSAENYYIDLAEDENAVKVLENNFQTLSIKFAFKGINSFDVNSKRGVFSEITIPNTYPIGKVGTPKLPAARKLIEIPFGAEVSVNVIDFTIEEYKLSNFGITNSLIPNQPSLSKSQNIDEVEFRFDESVYSNDEFISCDLARIEVLGTLRGVRLAQLTVAPVSYNPVTETIKVYNNIEVEVNFVGSDIALTQEIKAATYSPYFDAVYQKVINYRDPDYPDHPDLTKYPIKYLIVSDPIFESTLQPFIEWKTKKGFEVIANYSLSSASAVQNWVHDQYNAGTPSDPAPTFLLIVGDTGEIPASATGSQTSKATDLYYCSVDGDMFPEIYYGRFSATNVSQLQAQIDKTLYYEKYEFADPSYLDNATLIAGADYSCNPTHGQPTVLYGTNNYYNTAHGFDDVNLYLTSYGGCYDTVNEGVTLINYTAHGSQTSWSDPSLSQSQVNSFTNNGKYPLAIGNCCLAADFGYGECFGETWARKANGGSIGYIGSAPSSYWDEDVYWSVGAFPTVGNGVAPSYEETTWGEYDAAFVTDYVSQDALIFIANLAVTEAENQGYSGYIGADYYWEAYNLLGDPSLVVYQTQGEINDVDYMDILPIGVDFFEVTAEPGSYVAISFEGVLHGTGLIDADGTTEISIIPFSDGGMADIIITKPQYQPIIAQVEVAPQDGPWISIDSYSINADGDGIIEFGETIYLTVTLENVGVEPATGISMTLSINDSYIT